MQAWTTPPLKPPAEIRLQDNLQLKGILHPPALRVPDGAPSATVEVVGSLEDPDARLSSFREWLGKDLRAAFRAPPASLQAAELNAFMGADPGDPAKTIQALVLSTRGWYQAPLQREAEERARVEALYR